MTKTSARYSPEVRARAVRMVLDHQADHRSQWAAISSIAVKFGCSAETLRKWVRRETDRMMRSDSGADHAQILDPRSGVPKLSNGRSDVGDQQ